MPRRRSTSRQRAGSVRRRLVPYRRRLRFELLEDRRVLAVMTVTSLQDDTLANLAGDGQLSLREAIEAINTGAAVDGIGPTSGTFGVDDKIVFDASLFAGGGQSIQLIAGELGLTTAVTIIGPGQDVLTIDAQQLSRIFNITATTGDFTLAGLTLTGGRTTGDDLAFPHFTNTFSGGAIRSLTSGHLTLDQSTVSGNSTAGYFARGGGIFANGAVTLTQSTVSGNGTATPSAHGGGIFADGAVALTQSTVSGNSTAGYLARGGGIFADGAVTLTQSTVSGNHTVGYFAHGGGIRAGGPVTVTQSTVSGNSTAGGSALGGGIVTGGSVTLTQSTVSGNSTAGNFAYGGGIRALGSLTLIQSTVSGNTTAGDFARGAGINAYYGAVTLTQSTVSGNSTAGMNAHGGGIIAYYGAVTLTQSTITENDALHATAMGGGVFQFNSAANRPFSISGSIVAGNTAGGVGADLVKDPQSTLTGNYSLIGTGVIPTAGGNNVETNDPQLGPLANNGGPTKTHALLPGSPAIDAGDPAAVAGMNGVPEFDQRGSGFPRVVNGRIDIGAFEVKSAGPALLGDYNRSGIVDAADYTVWRDTLGQSGLTPYSGADGDGDGEVTVKDFGVWKSHFGQTLPLPETAAGTLVAARIDAVALSDVSELAGQPATPALRPVALASLFELPAWPQREIGTDGSAPLVTIHRDLALPPQAVDLLLAVVGRLLPHEALEGELWLPDRNDLDEADGNIPHLALDTALAERDADF